ncbi:hypothetical protein [Novosphingobium sp. Chol11]|uniref:hypothetical protein n=1 Tax=Novosphingobium sp. Chol11 TaxID=1385763 RepID=UPI000BE25A50|nr:hypothetical protein [Novosphingobium sp. Chol11]
MADQNGAKVVRRFSGKASDAPDRELSVQRSQRGSAGSGAQLRAVRKDGWTVERRKIFMETLAATCNVSEAARVAGKNLSSAYYQKRRDPGFAREWAQALSVGYGELEALLLRQALFGTEEEEVVLDGEGMVKSRKVKRGHPNAVGVRLLLQHRREVGEKLAAETVDRPDGADAVERLRAALERVRERRG